MRRDHLEDVKGRMPWRRIDRGNIEKGLEREKMWPRSTNREGKWREEIERRNAAEVERESPEITLKGDCKGRSREWER